MTDEEIKAIDSFKKLDFFEYDWQIRDEDFETREEMLAYAEKMQKIILHLINNQQKEIKVIQNDKTLLIKINEMILSTFISKDKIREKIKHYNNELEHIKNGEEFENEKPMYYWGKIALELLLEESQEDGDHIPRID